MHLNRHALRAIRQRSGLTVSALARRAEVSQPHLSNIERGRRQASPELIGRLAAALRVPIVALLAEVDDEPGPGASPPVRDRSSPRRVGGGSPRSSPSASSRRRHPAPARQQGTTMPDNPVHPSAPLRGVAMPDVQLVGPPDPGPLALGGRARRGLGLVAAGLASAGAVLGAVAPAHAETYYTGQCSVTESYGGETFYRTFQARIIGVIEGGTGKYVWGSYDYKYSIDLHLTSGASSNEEVNFATGYSDGLSNPWNSPDNHGSSGDWISEGNWKNAKSYWGSTKVRFYVAFDIPGTPDPHCNSYTATV